MNKIETMTAKEMSIAERKAGVSIATLEDPNFPKTDLLIALGWVLAKRDNPSLTFEEYGDKTLTEIVEELGLNEGDDEGN